MIMGANSSIVFLPKMNQRFSMNEGNQNQISYPDDTTLTITKDRVMFQKIFNHLDFNIKDDDSKFSSLKERVLSNLNQPDSIINSSDIGSFGVNFLLFSNPSTSYTNLEKKIHLDESFKFNDRDLAQIKAISCIIDENLTLNLTISKNIAPKKETKNTEPFLFDVNYDHRVAEKEPSYIKNSISGFDKLYTDIKKYIMRLLDNGK